jgi:hypothetical protein
MGNVSFLSGSISLFLFFFSSNSVGLFQVSLGDIPWEELQHINNRLAQAAMVMFVIYSYVLLLNLLIGKIAGTLSLAANG